MTQWRVSIYLYGKVYTEEYIQGTKTDALNRALSLKKRIKPTMYSEVDTSRITHKIKLKGINNENLL